MQVCVFEPSYEGTIHGIRVVSTANPLVPLAFNLVGCKLEVLNSSFMVLASNPLVTFVAECNDLVVELVSIKVVFSYVNKKSCRCTYIFKQMFFNIVIYEKIFVNILSFIKRFYWIKLQYIYKLKILMNIG